MIYKFNKASYPHYQNIFIIPYFFLKVIHHIQIDYLLNSINYLNAFPVIYITNDFLILLIISIDLSVA